MWVRILALFWFGQIPSCSHGKPSRCRTLFNMYIGTQIHSITCMHMWGTKPHTLLFFSVSCFFLMKGLVFLTGLVRPRENAFNFVWEMVWRQVYSDHVVIYTLWSGLGYAQRCTAYCSHSDFIYFFCEIILLKCSFKVMTSNAPESIDWVIHALATALLSQSSLTGM